MNVQTVDLTEQTTGTRDSGYPHRSGVRAVSAFAILFAFAVVLAVVGRASRVEALALIGGYGVVFFGIGAAPFQLRPDLDLYARLTGSILVGFSVLLIAGALMADVRGLWDPVVTAVIVGAAAMLLHLAGLARAHGWLDRRRPWSELDGLLFDVDRLRSARQSQWAEPDRLWPALTRRWSDRKRGWQEVDRRTPAASALLTGAGTLLWLVPALLIRDPNPGYWGMLTTIGPFWYAGLVLVLLGFAIGRGRELAAAAAVVSFGLATTLTPALVYGAPREPTSAKQMELTQYVLSVHHIHVTAGIYQAFSSMFGGMAALCQLLGIHGMLGGMSLWGVATYWPVMLVLLRVAVLRFLTGRLLATSARRWGAVMLVLLVDSLGADYYSPQAIGYVMAIGIVAVAINGVTPRPLGKRTTFLLLLLAGVALGPTHELSPYMAAGALVVLALFGQAPWWTCLPVGLPALAWAGVVHNAIAQNFNFAALFSLTNFRPPLTVATPGLQRLAVVGVQSHLLLAALLLLILLGTIGFLANVRTRWAWAYGLCPIVGIAFIVINPYGNEGIFRATLFAIPWIAVLAMKIPRPRGRLGPLTRPRVITAAVSCYLLGLLGTFVGAAYAMDGTMVLARGDVAVVDHLMRLPPHHAFVLSIGSANNPADGASFTLNYTTLEWSQVAKQAPPLQARQPTASSTVALAHRFGVVAASSGARRSSSLYVIWARSSALYCRAYGLQSAQQMESWLRALKSSPQWRLVDRSDGTYLFRLG